MLTLRIPPPWYTAIRKLHWRAPVSEGGVGVGGQRVEEEGQKKKKRKTGVGTAKAKINDRSHWWKSCAIF